MADCAAAPFVDPAGLAAFWREQYLAGYVRDGGGAVKWLRGREGSGKSRLLEAVAAGAHELGYVTAHLDAGTVSLGRFDELYRVVMQAVPIDHVARALAQTAARGMGAGDWSPDGGESVEAHLVRAGRPLAAVQDDMARALDFLYAGRELEPPVAAAARRLALAHLQGGESARGDAATAARWLRGERLLAPERRRTGIYLAIDRYSARDVLRSVLHLVRMAGIPGMVWTVDGLERLLVGRHLERLDGDAAGAPATVRYSALRRLDAYEGIRELIDEAGGLPGLFVLYAGRPEVYDDERAGLVTYPALAMRVQTEVEADVPNLFNDVQDLDRLWQADWPAHQRQLVRAYGRGVDTADLDLSAALGGAHVSPVRRLVELLTAGAAAAGGDAGA